MFQNREEAGNLLSQKLNFCKNSKDTIILAIPRGGVVVGRQIAKILNLPLSLVVIKKLGAPKNPELAIGAIAPDGVKYIDWKLVERLEIEEEYLDHEIKDKSEEVKEKIKKFKIRNPKSEIRNKKKIILTDDGIATGATTLAAIKYIKHLYPKPYTLNPKIILAVPVIAKDTFDRLKSEVDKIVALEVPGSFKAVGQFYKEFEQIIDEEVIKLL